MSGNDSERRSDLTLTSVAALLAIFSTSFAIYMNTVPSDEPVASINARRPDNGAYRWRDPIAADPIVTGSGGHNGTAGNEPLQMRTLAQEPLYQLVTVAGGKAYVVETGADPHFLIAVGVGSVLPGVGRVIAIDNRAGRWVVETTRATITSEVLPSLP